MEREEKGGEGDLIRNVVPGRGGAKKLVRRACETPCVAVRVLLSRVCVCDGDG